MQGSRKIPINDLNQHITCKICNGYFVDATTIIECLHTFCRSCIVKYLESNKYCPVCDVQVHKTKPLLNIRPDKAIQDIVYKLVPRLFQNEMLRRREFYENHPEAKPSSLEMCGEAAYQHLLTPEESVCLSLNYHGSSGTPRYLRCLAAVPLGHLKKLIRAKYDLTANHRVEILYNQDCLASSLTLMDVAYIYMWKRKGPIELTYRIYECSSAKKLKLEAGQPETTPSDAQNHNNNNNWKEVQLRISETGEMSITGIQDGALSPSLLEIVNGDQQKYKNDVVTVVESESPSKSTNVKKELPGLKYIGKNTAPAEVSKTESDLSDSISVSVPSTSFSQVISSAIDVTAPSFLSSCATLSSGTTTMVFSTINNTKCSTKTDDSVPMVDPSKAEAKVEPERETVRTETVQSETVTNNVAEKGLKRKGEEGDKEGEPAAKQAKPTILNHSLGLLNLSNNHPLRKHSKMNRNGESVKEIVLRSSTPQAVPVSEPPTTTSASLPTVATKTPTTTTSTDTTFSKPSVVNKNLAVTQPSRPGTPIATTRPSIMSTKPSIIPSKPPIINVYSNTVKSPCYMPKTNYNPVINVPKPVTSTGVPKTEAKPPTVAKTEQKSPSTSNATKTEEKPGNTAAPLQQVFKLNNKQGVKSKPNSPIGYKTLRDPPKSWNSQISKANLSKPPLDPKYSDLKNVRPAKFFKMRNNMPRYLGNPASGVKPMYQVHVSPEKEKPQDQLKMEKSEIRKHSIVKIDPKTLKPISEKAPETTSLSNHSGVSPTYQNLNSSSSNQHQSMSNSCQGMNSGPMPNQTDLKINTSSVSIFNPLKLQGSPKNERRSPKSPHSPKLKGQAGNSTTTGSKREKVNLNFTPPNPFVPNLASPTVSPNQFLYPTGHPPGFPAYDPRVMAAYHSLWYGQRMGFPAAPMPRLGLELSQQRKNSFEMMPSPTSPKTGGNGGQQGHSAQISTKITSTTTSSTLSAAKAQNLPPPSSPKPHVPTKKSPKETKAEKSLETTVEKLTQNRNKEIGGKAETTNVLAQQAAGRAESAEKEKAKRLEGGEGGLDKRESSENVERSKEDANKCKTSKSAAGTPTNASSRKSSPEEASQKLKSNEIAEKRPPEGEKPQESGKEASVSDVCGKKNEMRAEPGSNPERNDNVSGSVNGNAKNGQVAVEGGK